MRNLFPLFCIFILSVANAHDFDAPGEGPADLDEMTGLQIENPTAEDFVKEIPGGPGNQAIGSYNKGRLQNATGLPPVGPGWIKLGQPANRHWGTFEMVTLFEQTASDYDKWFPNAARLRVGDISPKNGGKTNEHSSHQIGLDVDVGFIGIYETRSSDEEEASRALGPSFVRGKKVIKAFDTEKNWRVIEGFVNSGMVNRVFVNEAIKTHFCNYAKAQGIYDQSIETLRRIRPWRGHTEHFHLRLHCPISHPQCIPQAEPPEGSGC